VLVISTQVRVYLLAWGVTLADVEHAIEKATWGEARQGWDFVGIKRLNELPCPLDVRDGRAIAADCDRYWAYVVYPVGESA
jgi:hypothetical protein